MESSISSAIYPSCNMDRNLTVRCFEDDYIIDRDGIPAMEWVFASISLTLMLAIFLGSGLIIATCIRIRKLLSLSNYLILQLAVADFALGCGLLYTALATVVRRLNLDHNLCALRQAMFMFPGTASFIGILVITCNRYIAIVHHPLTYQVTPSRRYYVMHTLIIWIPSAFLGFLLPMMWHNHCPSECSFSLIMTTSFLKYAFLPFFLLRVLPVTALYARIFFTATKQLRKIADTADQGQQEALGKQQEHVSMKGQVKILKVALLIFVTFYISWLPFLVIMGIQLHLDNLDQMSAITTARLVILALFPINSAANPFIYAYRLPELRSELSMMLLNWRTCLCREGNWGQLHQRGAFTRRLVCHWWTVNHLHRNYT